jgi:DNA-binding NarL/FixJ family response regulator
MELRDIRALLTRQERRILIELLKGKSYSDIETVLVVNYATVKTHISNIYKKLQVRNQAELLFVSYNAIFQAVNGVEYFEKALAYLDRDPPR